MTHMLSGKGGRNFHWDSCSPWMEGEMLIGTCALRECRGKFQLGHVLAIIGGCIVVWDAVSPCCSPKMEGGMWIRTCVHRKWGWDARLRRVVTLFSL